MAHKTWESYWRYKHSQRTSKRYDREGHRIEWKLTLDEMVQLAEEAGITPDQVGTKNTDHLLGRINDLGNYEVGNCRFITVLDNKIEGRAGWTLSDESIAKSHATKMERYGTLNHSTPESVAKSNATKKRNGTMNAATPESIAKQIATRKRNGTHRNAYSDEAKAKGRATKMERYGTLSHHTPESLARGWATRRANKAKKLIEEIENDH